MKKLKNKNKGFYKIYRIKHAIKIFLKKKKRLQRKKNTIKTKTIIFSNEKSKHPKKITKIIAPNTICLDKNQQESLKFIQKIRTCSNRRDHLKIDFTTLNYISPECALILAAEIDRYRIIKNCKIKVVDIEKWKPEIIELFQQMGTFELLEIKNFKDLISENLNNTKFIKFERGNIVDSEKIADILKRISEFENNAKGAEKHIQMALSEAMTNTSHWAYPKDFINSSDLKESLWWMSASFNKEKSLLSVMIYDEGRTIPKTLSPKIGERIRNLTGNKDSNMIKFATKENRSQTGEPNRGRGLPDMKKFAERISNGELTIISNKGFFKYVKDNNMEFIKDMSQPLKGTLIVWRGTFNEKLDIDKNLYSLNKC